MKQIRAKQIHANPISDDLATMSTDAREATKAQNH